MHRLKMLSLRTTLLSATLKCVAESQPITVSGTCLPIKSQFQQFSNKVEAKSTSISIIEEKPRRGIFGIIKSKFDAKRKQLKLLQLAYILYTNTVDNINYPQTFEDFNLPDTFVSWFLITELHIWMLMLRFMAEGEDGKEVRNRLSEAMWEDVKERLDRLGYIPSRTKSKQILDLSYQFNAAMIIYDEGILSNDKILAAALWRRYFSSECNNPEHLEKLLIYVRKQVHILDKISSEEMFKKTRIEWVDYNTIS